MTPSSLKNMVTTGLAFLLVVAAAHAQTEYVGTFRPADKTAEFIASSSRGDSLIFRTAYDRAATFTSENRRLLLHYNNDGVIVSEDSVTTKLTYIKKGLKDDDGKTYTYQNVKHWEICLANMPDGREVVKGNYEFSGDQVKLTLWVQDGLSNPALVATIVRSLMIQTRTIQESNEWLLLMITALSPSSK